MNSDNVRELSRVAIVIDLIDTVRYSLQMGIVRRDDAFLVGLTTRVQCGVNHWLNYTYAIYLVDRFNNRSSKPNSG
jgi:hypothetical protein